MALQKYDGFTAWSSENDGMTHATPVYATIDDVPQVIFLTRAGLVAVVPESGEILWRLRFAPSAVSTAASPAVMGNFVYGSSAFGSGTWLALVGRNGDTFSATQAWRQQGNAYQAHWATPVTHGGYFYCVSGQNSSQVRLTCLDPKGGTNLWAQARVGSGNLGFGSVIKAVNTLVVLTEAGELVLVGFNPEAYTELGRFKVLNEYCWNNVALANERIYARSTSASPEIVAVDISKREVELPSFGLTTERRGADGRSVRLTVRSESGSLDPAQAALVELVTTTNSVTTPPAQWSVIPQPFAPSNGTWVTDFQLGTEPNRFLRVREKKEALPGEGTP